MDIMDQEGKSCAGTRTQEFQSAVIPTELQFL
jgi:hypothetical protein